MDVLGPAHGRRNFKIVFSEVQELGGVWEPGAQGEIWQSTWGSLLSRHEFVRKNKG